MVRELGPVLAGLMVAGRVGSGIAAQLGSMRVTEQIDALNTLGTDPIKKLVTPRVLACLIMLPVLTVINDFVGILGGNIIAKFYLGQPTALYWRTVFEQMLSGGFTLHYIPNDFVQGLTKPFVFGGIISHGCVLSRPEDDRWYGGRRAGNDPDRRGGEHPHSRRRLFPHPDTPGGVQAMSDDEDDRRKKQDERRHPSEKDETAMPRRAHDSGRVRKAIRTELEEVAEDTADKQPKPDASREPVISLENISLPSRSRFSRTFHSTPRRERPSSSSANRAPENRRFSSSSSGCSSPTTAASPSTAKTSPTSPSTMRSRSGRRWEWCFRERRCSTR